MKARFRKPLAMFLVVMMLFTLMPAGMVFGDTTQQPIAATVEGETDVTMKKGIDFITADYYAITSPQGIEFKYTEASITSENPPLGIGVGVNQYSGAYLKGIPEEIITDPVQVTINVVATDENSNVYQGSITVSITVEDTPVDKKLEEMIEKTECVVSMDDANTPEEVVKWIKETWLPSLDGYTDYKGLYGDLSVVAVIEGEENEIERFKAAVAGTKANPGGEDGFLYVQFPLDENYNYLGGPKKCTIKATPYSSGGGSSINSYTPPVEKPDEDGWEYFTFNNDSDDFFASNETQNYKMDKYMDDFEAALKELYPNSWVGTLNNVKNRINSTWGGSCYGFASVELLANLDLLDIMDYYAVTNSLPKVKAPVDTDDKDVRSLLNYYYMTQFVPAMRSEQNADGPYGGITDMADKVVNGERYMFSYFFSYNSAGSASYGHSIILDGGEKHADGSYTLKGYDNRYHKYFWAENNADKRKVEGTPVFVDVVIDRGGNCTIKPPSGDITMQGDTRNTYTFGSGKTEYVTRYEAMLADESSAMVKQYAAFMPEAEEVTVAPRGEVVYFYVDEKLPESAENQFVKKYYIAGAVNAPTVSGSQVKMNDVTDSLSMLAVLDKAEDITIANPTGRLALVDGNLISSATVEKASSVTLSTNSNTAEIKDNNGKFTMQVTAQSGSSNYVVYTITGSGSGNVKATATANGVEFGKDGTINTSVTSETFTVDLRIVMQINNKNIVVNNKTITNDVAPVIVDDRTLVPVRIVTELLGGTADWDEATRTVTLTIDGKVLKLVIDEEIPGYGTGAAIIDNRTYVPIRYIAEKLGANVEWLQATQQIIIEK